MLTPSSCLRPNQAEVAAKVMDGEAIIINLSNGMYYSMDQIGGLIWELIDQGCSLAQIVLATTQTYDVSPTRVQADLERLAAELVEENLVVISDQPAPGRPPQEPARPLKLPYEPPQLNKYRDMADLLALDPPMPGLPDIPWQGPAERPARGHLP